MTRHLRLHGLLLDEHVVLAAVCLNALVLTALAFEPLHDQPALEALDYLFTTYFVIEALLKIRRDGWKGYTASGWNRFDFTIVLISLPSYAALFLELPDLSFLLILRVARVAKFFRFIRFVPNIGGLVDGARRAIRASSFVLLALFVFNFVIALLSCYLFAQYAPEYFGNPFVSIYSIFRVFTIEGWYEIPDAISENGGATLAFFARVYFMGVVLAGGLFGLSLIGAIFVDEMLRDDNDAFERRLDEMSAKLDRLLADRDISESVSAADRDNP